MQYADSKIADYPPLPKKNFIKLIAIALFIIHKYTLNRLLKIECIIQLYIMQVFDQRLEGHGLKIQGIPNTAIAGECSHYTLHSW